MVGDNMNWINNFTDTELGKIYRIHAYVKDVSKPITTNEIQSIIGKSRTSAKLIAKLIEYNVFNIKG